jgi:hypothetical protein
VAAWGNPSILLAPMRGTLVAILSKNMRQLFFILFSVVFIHSHGQNPNWIPMPDSNATWCAQRGFLVTGNPDAFHTYNSIQYISGDTLINGLVYHKIYESGILEVMTIPPTSWTFTYYNDEYVGCIRENSNRQAFQIPNYLNFEFLLYDFNLQIGDTVPTNSLIILSGIDSIFDGTNYRQRFKLSSADSSFWPDPFYYEHVSWIEGIGSTGGNFFSLGPYFEHGGRLYEFTQNGIAYYQDSITPCNLSLGQSDIGQQKLINVYPNPIVDKLNIVYDAQTTEDIIVLIFDLSGKKLFHKTLQAGHNEIDLKYLDSGIYIYRMYVDKMFIRAGKMLKQ